MCAWGTIHNIDMYFIETTLWGTWAACFSSPLHEFLLCKRKMQVKLLDFKHKSPRRYIDLEPESKIRLTDVFASRASLVFLFFPVKNQSILRFTHPLTLWIHFTNLNLDKLAVVKALMLVYCSHVIKIHPALDLLHISLQCLPSNPPQEWKLTLSLMTHSLMTISYNDTCVRKYNGSNLDVSFLCCCQNCHTCISCIHGLISYIRVLGRRRKSRWAVSHLFVLLK